MAEWDFIDRLRQQVKEHPQVPIGIGDDAAHIMSPSQGLLVTNDMLMDGVHFNLATTDPLRIGRKALAVNLSDIAAMGGKAQAAFVALAIPRSMPSVTLDAIMMGFMQLAAEYDVAIAGGDTNVWNGPFVISVTLTGLPHPKGIIKRSGAKPFDVIFVTGNLGCSLSGHHLDFTPRMLEAKLLHEQVPIRAMIDLSDGLATDLRHLLKASGVAAIIEQAALPLSPSLKALAPPLAYEAAVSDGEDFELCFTVSEADAATLLKLNPIAPVPLTAIGRIVTGHELYWGKDLSPQLIMTSMGYQHR